MINNMIKNYNEYINEKLTDNLKGFNKNEIEQQLIDGKITSDKYYELCKKYNFEASEDIIHDYVYEQNKNNMDELLCEACKHNCFDLVKLAIENDANINYANSNPIINIIYNNNTEIFNYLVEHGAKVESPFGVNYLVNAAVFNNNLDIIKTIIEKDKSLDLRKLLYDTITIYYKIDIAKYLIKYGIDIHQLNITEMVTLLVNNNKIEVLDFVLNQNVTITDDVMKYIKLRHNVNKEISLLLTDYYEKQTDKINEANFADLLNPTEHISRNLKHELPSDMLIRAAKEGNFHYVSKAIELGADIHAKHDYALFTACDNNNINCIKILIDNNADIHVADDYILRWNCRVGNTDVVKMLLKYGADPLVNDYEPLKVAIKYDNKEIVKVLLSTEKYKIDDIFNEIYKEIDDESEYKYILLEYKFKHK